jgi:ferredoxin-thioredoxin reductase catalytic subunit
MTEPVTRDQQAAWRAEIAERVARHAKASGLRLNPNAKAFEALLDGLVRRKVRFGDYYCPCRVVTGDPNQDAANVCPCQSHGAEVAATGHCHCGLFFAAER